MPRTIETATLIHRQDFNETLSLFRFTLEGGIPDYQPGQFVTLGLPIPTEAGKVVWRAYSIASPPSQKDYLELYIREPLNPLPGRFTSELWRLPIGGTLQHRGITGPFTVEEAFPDGRTDNRRLLLVGGGTGVAPFIAYALELRKRQTPRELIVLHGASYIHELGYHDLLTRLQEETRSASAGYKVRYIPSISRPRDEANRGWTGETGRIEQLLLPAAGATVSRLEDMLQVELTPENFFCHVCGYDGTVKAASAVLEPKGFRTRRNKRPDGSYDIKVESYG